MDDDDFRSLVALLEQELRDAGATDIADERHYLRPDAEADVVLLLDPQKRLVEMLRAFERKLAVEDRETYLQALERINDNLYGEGPRGALFELAREPDREPIVVDLGTAPELGELREQTRQLIGRLLESR